MGLFGIKRSGKTSPGVHAILEKLGAIETRLDTLERRLELMDHFSNGARATYMGDDRVLMKCVVANAQIAFLVEARDKLLSPWFIVSGAYETDVTNYFVRALAQDSRCIDVGSNFGYFTCLMGRFCPQGKIVGIEADEHIYELTRDNVFINGFNERTTVMCAAVSDAPGVLTLHRRATRSGNTSIAQLPEHYIQAMGEPDSLPFTVRAITLDEIVAEMGGRVDFVKVDVEGAEPLVFRGAHKTIQTNPHIRIVMEWSPGQMRAAGFDARGFLDELEAMGLKAHDFGTDDPLNLIPLTMDELAGLDYRAGVVLTCA